MLYLHIKYKAQFEHSSAGKFISKPDSVHPKRNLQTYVLLLGSQGEYPIRIEEREYVLKKGTFMLLMAGYEHAGTGVCRNDQAHYWCHFNVNCAYVSESPVCEKDEYVIPEYGEISAYQKLKIIFRQLIDCASDPNLPEFARYNECSAYLSILMNETTVALMQSSGAYKTGENRTSFIEYVCQWIRANSVEINASDVARAFPYNHDYLTRIFKKKTGFTIAGYINECKLDNVKKMLLETNHSVKEIALLCGYSDEKRMMKLFRKRLEVTPTEYRKAFSSIYLNNK